MTGWRTGWVVGIHQNSLVARPGSMAEVTQVYMKFEESWDEAFMNTTDILMIM